MEKFRIAILAAQTGGDYKALYNTLTQSINWLGKDWGLTKPVDANVIFMLVSSAKSLKTLQALQPSLPIHSLIVANSTQVDLPQIKWHMPFPKRQPCPSILAVASLLSLIQEHIEGHKNPNPVGFFDPSQHLTDIIENCLTDGDPRLCSLDNGPSIILAPKDTAYYFDGEWDQVMPLALADKAAIKVKKISADELAEKTEPLQFGSRLNKYADFGDAEILPQMGVKQSLKGNIKDLMWFSVLVASRGKPLKSYSLNDKALLHEIPELLQTDYFSQQYKPMADLLIAKPISLIDASVINQRSLFDTINFYNACTVLKLTEASQ